MSLIFIKRLFRVPTFTFKFSNENETEIDIEVGMPGCETVKVEFDVRRPSRVSLSNVHG